LKENIQQASNQCKQLKEKEWAFRSQKHEKGQEERDNRRLEKKPRMRKERMKIISEIHQDEGEEYHFRKQTSLKSHSDNNETK